MVRKPLSWAKMVFGPEYVAVNPGSHMSPMVGESLSVVIQGENSQRILLAHE